MRSLLPLLGVLGGLAAGVVLTVLALRPTPDAPLQTHSSAAKDGAPAPSKGPASAAVPGPAVQVLPFYPGLPAPTVEKTITNRVERWVNQAPGVRRIESHSVAGASIVRVRFRKDADPATVLAQVNALALG